MNESSLKKRYVVKLFASIVNGVIGMALVAIVPRTIGPVAYGQFVYLQQFFTQLIGFLDASTSIAFFTKLSANSERKELIAFYTRYSVFIFLLLITSFYILGVFEFTEYILPNIKNEYINLGLIFCFFTWFTQILIKISDAYAMTVSIEITKIFHKVISLALLICIVAFGDLDLKLYLYLNIIMSIFFVVLVLVIIFNRKVISWYDLSLKSLQFKGIAKEFVSYCMPLFFYSVVGLIASIFDIWLLQNVSGSIETGFYGLSYSIAAMCFIFTGAMTPIITREFSKSFKEGNIDLMSTYFKRYIPMMYAISVYFSVFIVFESESVLKIFADDKFEGALSALMVMAVYPIHQTYGQLSGSIFYATGQTKLYNRIGMVSFTIGMLLTTLFVYFLELGALGLGMKMVMAQVIAVNIQLYFSTKFLNLKMSYFLMHQFLAVIFLGSCAYLSSYLIEINNVIVDFLITGLVYSIFVLLIFFVYPNLFSIKRFEVSDFVHRLLHVRSENS
ncbi:lipopolysaccharide biosynthesis protein [Vibrio genomosp. F10]|uniref:lipopolysaccharide biosynthesis protein n=1 Tax=Vibrio genomosp. F10 TaxID=723171 RepID=UPI000311C751|nr:oligosaccharide flippase family protein [Vibrio genomosp. F10]OEF04572.1 polysaccharide biosynthesis protein [Vibrio genomosp. F10 str. 9ZB36]